MRSSSLPPGPKNTPYWTYRFATAPIATHQKLAKEYGDPFTLPLLAGRGLITGKPDLIRQIYGAPPSSFEPYTTLTPLVGSSSLFVVSGERHLRDRKLFAPLFHGKGLASYVPGMRNALAAEVSRMHDGVYFDILEMTQRLSFAIMAGAAFGMETDEEARALERALADVLGSVPSIFIFFPILQKSFFGKSPWDRFLEARARFDRILFGAIRKRRASPNDSIVSRMFELRRTTGEELTDQEVRDLLVTLLLGGYESTAIAMAWMFYAVARDQAVQNRLRDEASALPADAEWKEVDKLPYLNAVFLESMRRFPAVPQTTRLLGGPFELGGYSFTKGQTVAASLILAHWNEERFPNPMGFDPSRFENTKVDMSTWLPFGGGARRCIGASLAECEAKVLLTSLLRTHQWTAEEGPVPNLVRRTLVLGPERPLRATVRHIR
ncbi:MAG: cytochrome P450 [Polyangiaceae bacterium]